MSTLPSALAFFTSRRFRKSLRLFGWLAFWAACVSTLAFTSGERNFAVGPLLLAGLLVLALAHSTAWLLKRLSRARSVRGAQALRRSYSA